MKKKITRACAVVMALAMIACLCAGTAFASSVGDPDGDGSDNEAIVLGFYNKEEAAPRYATYVDEDLIGITLTDDVSWHNGAIYMTEGEYTISGSTIIMDSDADGSDTNDFSGLGAAVMAINSGVVLTIEDTTIETTGVAKLALFTDNGAVSIVKNSSLTANGGTLYDGYYSTADQSMMVTPPWVLGLGGTSSEVNARTTNLMGDNSVAVYVDSTFYAAGWGALSMDSGSTMNMVVINSDVTVGSSGYGAYAISYSTENYYGTNMDVTTYGVIMTGAEATFQSYTEGENISVVQYSGETDEYGIATNGTEIFTIASEEASGTVTSSIDSDNFGFMFHSNGTTETNIVNVLDGTSVTSGDAIFLIKKVNAIINVDSADLTSGTGVLLQIIDNDDDYVGVNGDVVWGMEDGYGHTVGSHTPTFNTTFSEEDGYSNEWIADTAAAALYEAGSYDTSTSWTADFTLTNTTVDGDIWNSSGYVGSNPATILSVTLGEGADLTGVISAGAFSHTSKYAEVGNGDWTNASVLGHVTNIVNSNGVNTVNVTMTDDAVWTVDAESYIDSLDITGSAVVTIAEGATLTVGDTTYEAGTITASGYTAAGTVVEEATEAAVDTDTTDSAGTTTDTADTTTSDSTAAEVGDSSNMVLWIVIAALAACTGTAVVIRKKVND